MPCALSCRAPGPFLVGGGRQECDGYQVAIGSGRARPLVVQVEAEVRLDGVADAFQDASLGGRQSPRIAVYIDPDRIVPDESLGTVRIQHRDHRDREPPLQPLSHGIVPGGRGEPVDDVGKRHRGGRLVAVHLRPQEQAGRAVADRNSTDGTSLDRLAKPVDPHPARPVGGDGCIESLPVLGVSEATFLESGHPVLVGDRQTLSVGWRWL